MSIPKVPDEAVMAAEGPFVAAGPIYGHTPLPILEAAWPHMYAAALRHAADRVDQVTAGGEIRLDVDHLLRRMADEVPS